MMGEGNLPTSFITQAYFGESTSHIGAEIKGIGRVRQQIGGGKGGDQF